MVLRWLHLNSENQTLTSADSSIEKTETGPAQQAATVGIRELLLCVIRREWTVAWRNSGQWVNPLLFFIVVVALFPLGVGPSPAMLSTIAPGILWVSALLAVLLSLGALFDADYADGTLEQLVLSGQSLPLIVLAKVVVHWLLSGLPLLLVSPFLGLLFNLPIGAIPVLMVSLLLGTLTLSLIGAIGAALTVGLNQAGVLLSLLVLPLSVPVLIFGSAAVTSAASDMGAAGPLLILAALLIFALSLAPLTAALALRNAVAGGN